MDLAWVPIPGTQVLSHGRATPKSGPKALILQRAGPRLVTSVYSQHRPAD